MWVGWVRAPGRRLGSPQPQLATGGLCLPLGESASLRSRDQRRRRPQAVTHRLFVTASWPETLVAEPTTRAVSGAGVGGCGVRDRAQVLTLAHTRLTYTGCTLGNSGERMPSI